MALDRRLAAPGLPRDRDSSTPAAIDRLPPHGESPAAGQKLKREAKRRVVKAGIGALAIIARSAPAV